LTGEDIDELEFFVGDMPSQAYGVEEVGTRLAEVADRIIVQ